MHYITFEGFMLYLSQSKCKLPIYCVTYTNFNIRAPYLRIRTRRLGSGHAQKDAYVNLCVACYVSQTALELYNLNRNQEQNTVSKVVKGGRLRLE